MKNLSVEEIVKAWLLANGYSGLCNDDCGCEIADLMPCGEVFGDCQAGYKKKCKKSCEHERFFMKDEWHIQLEK